jgi:hypothetical protein
MNDPGSVGFGTPGSVACSGQAAFVEINSHMPDQHCLDKLADIDRELAILREKHRTALTAGDFPLLNQIQVELAELMERREQLQLLDAS